MVSCDDEEKAIGHVETAEEHHQQDHATDSEKQPLDDTNAEKKREDEPISRTASSLSRQSSSCSAEADTEHLSAINGAAAAGTEGNTGLCPVGTTPSLNRSVTEVRDGIQNQRDPELGHELGERPSRANLSDPNLVSWSGLDDPENPKSWPMRRKWAVVICVSLFTFISPVASSMVAPALPNLGRDLNIPSSTDQMLVMSIFVAAYAVGPLIWAPLSEIYGRVLVIQVTNACFLCFNLGCALARTRDQMMAFRFLSGLGGSATLGIGGGVLADLFVPEERGRAVSVYSLMPLLGPAVGPVAGGWIAELTTWRWVFWSTSIGCAGVQVAGLCFLGETYAPVLLRRRRDRLVVETDNKALRTEFDLDDPTRQSLFRLLAVSMTRPFRLLATQPIVQVLALYMMYLYGLVYLVYASFPELWRSQYGQSPGFQGLNYISLGLGLYTGSQVCARLQDRIYVGLKRRYVPDGGPGRPEFRVPLMVPGSLIVPVGLFIYSWTAEAGTHWIGPNVGAAIYAAGTIVCFQCIQGYIVDSYPRYAASTVAAVTVLRSLAAFGFPLFAPALYVSLGYGWGGTLLACCGILIGWPSPILLWVYGQRLRARSKFAA